LIGFRRDRREAVFLFTAGYFATECPRVKRTSHGDVPFISRTATKAWNTLNLSTRTGPMPSRSLRSSNFDRPTYETNTTETETGVVIV